MTGAFSFGRNLTLAMSPRRLTRLTDAFSKKPRNLQASVASHFAHYNLVRGHKMTVHGQEFSQTQAAGWFAGKTFGYDWTSSHFPIWAGLLARYRDLPARVIEVGSWEGRSALFFMNFLPRSTLVCIDTFEGSEEHRAHPEAFANDLPEIERRFDANLAPFAHRLEKRKAPSAVALAEFGIDGRRFDIAYIDGSHASADVYGDGVLTWSMLVPGGIMMFDDYEWEYLPEPRSNPKLGIDSFLSAFEGQYRIIYKGFQVALEKL
jgi:Methyltransferase domain